jgi:hypothetical protein
MDSATECEQVSVVMVDPRPRVPEDDPFATPTQIRASFVQRRRKKVLAEIERNRRGEHRIPTWAMVLMIVAIVAAWILIVVLA